MKTIKRYTQGLVALFALLAGVALTACEDQPDKYEVADGVPTVKYVRLPAPVSADSLLTGAYMENTICLVGDNLRSIVELYFNDQKAVLNTSYMTDHTLLVDVPKNIPEEVTDKLYMITRANDTIPYDFKVLVPAPAVNSLSCEFAAPGSEVTIYGDYLLDDPNTPLTIEMAGNVKVTNITSISKTQVSFVLPANAIEGYITVTSLYGTGRSKFVYHDTRNILFDWDDSHGGLATGHGWRAGVVRVDDPVAGIDGSYLYFGGAAIDGAAGATWAEDQFCFNYWPEPSAGYPALSAMPKFAEMLSEYGWDKLQLKFEVNVPASNPWQSAALQAMFTSDADVTNATGNNNYYSSDKLPRGLWLPWNGPGSYDTGGKWVTVSMKLADFNKTPTGTACAESLNPDHFTGLTFFVWNGGLAGTTCNPVICFDNIRVVPVE
ncbi:MAG: glycan-binding surface protein [Mediterranea sp.]|jgi:hypothetical protein|nr:glycan-binding surface protein [Mediterranea sp.]